MLDLSQTIKIEIYGQIFEIDPFLHIKTLIKTVLERGDPEWLFPTEIILEQLDDESWQISRGLF